MIDTELYTEYPYYGAYTSDDRFFNPENPRMKDLFWNHYSWLEEMETQGKVRLVSSTIFKKPYSVIPSTSAMMVLNAPNAVTGILSTASVTHASVIRAAPNIRNSSLPKLK